MSFSLLNIVRKPQEEDTDFLPNFFPPPEQMHKQPDKKHQSNYDDVRVSLACIKGHLGYGHLVGVSVEVEPEVEYQYRPHENQ